MAAAGLVIAIGVVATLTSPPPQPKPIVAAQPTLKLPFPSGYSSKLVQGPGGSFSHGDTFSHFDIDLDTAGSSAAENTLDEVVTAGASGTAFTLPDKGAHSFGNHVNIDHGPVDPNNPGGPHYFTIYAHLKTFLVKNGQPVVQGQPIGMDGCTGFCDGDHVHFGLHTGNPAADALQSTSISADQIVARDVTANGQFTTFKSEDFIVGHSYQSNNDYPQDCRTATEWNFANDSRCWFFGINGGATTIGFNPPGAWILSVGNDPYVISPPLSIDAASVSAIEIRMASEAVNTTAEVFFSTDTAPGFAPERSRGFTISNDGGYQTYTVSFSGNSAWKGKITQLRIDPVAGGNQEAVGLMSVRLVTNGNQTNTPSPEGFHDYVDCNNVGGWVRDKNNPGMRLSVVVIDDNTGAIVGTGTADQFRQDLLNVGIGDGKYGFTIPIPAGLKDGQNHNLRVKVLNTDFSLKNTPKTYNSNTLCGATTQPPSFEGFHDFVSCDAIGGWARDKNNPGTRLNVSVINDATGAVVASGPADQFRQDLVNVGIGDGKYGFTIPMPAALKDGQTRNLRVIVTGTNFSLKNTPKSFNSNVCGTTTQPPFYEGFHDFVDCNNIGGWVRDKNNPGTRLNVSVINDATGAVVASGIADQFRQDLVNAGIGDGKYGFTIPMPAALKDGQTRNLRVIVTGTNFSLKNTPKSFNSSVCGTTTQPPFYEGFHDFVDCNNIGGWVRDKNNPGTRLNVSVINDATGAVVASGIADQFRQDLVNAGIGDGKYGFTIPMPAALKDGQTRNLRVIVTGTDFSLKNTPKSFNSSVCGTTTQPPFYEGFHDFIDCNNIGGWVRDKNNPGTRVNVSVVDDTSGTVVASGTADQFRQDLLNAGIGDGKYGFLIPTPSALKNGQSHAVRVTVTGQNFNLKNTPKTFSSTCSSGPDLVVTNSSGSSSIVPGGTINVSGSITNQGTGAAGAFRLGFYLSTDSQITTSDILLGTCSFNGLSAGASTSCSGPLTVPQLSPGSYSLGTFVDDQNSVAESNEGNNIRVVSGIVVDGSPITWEFNTNGDFLGWAAINISAASVSSGVLFIDPSGADPYVEGPSISASASVYKTVVVRLASNGLDAFGNIYFRTQSENFYSSDKRVAFTVQNCSLCGNASFVTYTINMNGNSKWTGTITGLRVDPANDGKAGTNTDSMGVDFIRLTP